MYIFKTPEIVFQKNLLSIFTGFFCLVSSALPIVIKTDPTRVFMETAGLGLHIVYFAGIRIVF